MIEFEITRASADIHRITITVENNSEILILLQEFINKITQHEKKSRVVLYDCVPGLIKLKCGRFTIYLSTSKIEAISIEHAGYSSSESKKKYNDYELAAQQECSKDKLMSGRAFR